MKRYEITWPTLNSVSYAKTLHGLVLTPDQIRPGTGAMLFSHGWGGSRYQHEDKMEAAAEAFDLVCLAVEYRQSGYDFDPVTGSGWQVPYDASFMQVFDVLNGLRRILALYPAVDRQRLFHWGGSQGGHLALLGACYAPQTFAWVYATSPVSHLGAAMQEWAGRAFADYELLARDVRHLASQFQCPVWLEHGTADPVVPWEEHTGELDRRLRALGKEVQTVIHAGGDHGLQPITDRLATFRARAPEPLMQRRRAGLDDFTAGRVVRLACGSRTLVIDWSRPPTDMGLFTWE